MNSVKLEGQKVHFEITQIGGVYEGTLSADQKQITGTWTQAGVPAQPLNLSRSETGASAKASEPAAAPGPKEKPITLPLDVTVPIAPTAFKADGKMHLVYELHIVNMSPWNCTLTGIDVLDAKSSRSLASYSGAGL